MSRPGGNPDLKGKKGRSGRKSASYEGAKRYLIGQAFYIGNKSLEKNSKVDEKEKRAMAMEIIKKELGKDVKFDIGDKLNKVLVEFIDGKQGNKNSNTD